MDTRANATHQAGAAQTPRATGRQVRAARPLAVAIALAGLLTCSAAAWAVPVEDTDADAAKGELVVTMFDCPLQDEDRVLQTIPAGTELLVNDVQGLFLSVKHDQTSGWVYARHVRTPAMLTRLKSLGDSYQGYKLWAEAYSVRPPVIALRRVGDPQPMPLITVNPDGSPQYSTVAATEEQRLRAGGLLDGQLRNYFVGRVVSAVDPDQPWTVVVACGQMKVQTSGRSLRILQYGDLYLIHRDKQRLVFQKGIAGEGPTELAVLSDFARQAADEYSKLARSIWSTAPGAVSIEPRPLVLPGHADPIPRPLPPRVLPPAKPVPVKPLPAKPLPAKPVPAKPFF